MSGSDKSRHVAVIGASLAAIAVLSGTLTYTFHIGELSGRNDAQAQGYAAAYPYDTSKQIADCWAKPDTTAIQECVASAIQASHEAQRSEADLSAQRQMSDWAFWALIVGIAMAFITTIGTYLIFRQVELTRKAVEDTGNATDAMLEANEIARAQSSPYIMLEDIQVSYTRQWDSLIEEFMGYIDSTFRFRNVGGSVAIVERYQMKIAAMPYMGRTGFSCGGGGIPTNFALQSGDVSEIMRGAGGGFNHSSLAKYFEGHDPRRCIVEGWVQCRNVHGVSRRYPFKYRTQMQDGEVICLPMTDPVAWREYQTPKDERDRFY